MCGITKLLCLAFVISLTIPQFAFANCGNENDNEEKSKKQEKDDKKDNKNKDGNKEKSETEGSGKLEVIEKITKSPNDPKDYLGIVLPNQLKVLLVSDSEADYSVGSLAVDVGCMQTPKKVQGLPHLLEHAVFLGSEKYPDKEVDNFLGRNGGYSNAYTSSAQTCYYFGVSSADYKGAADRFFNMFISPTLDEEVVLAEMKVVNDEYSIHCQQDIFRIMRVNEHTCASDHDFNNFGSGNEESLVNIPKKEGLSLGEEIKKFYNKYYSANNMAAVLYAKESIEELRTLAEDVLSQIEDKNVKYPVYEDPPFTEKELMQTIYILPVKDIYTLTMKFVIPDPTPDYTALPFAYINYFTNNRGENSVYAFLKKQGWVSTIACSYNQLAKNIALYDILLDLTPSGVENVHEIVVHIFEYINLVKTDGIQESYYEEIEKIARTKFEWSFMEDPNETFTYMSADLLNYNLEDILIAGKVPLEWQPDLIEKYLDFLKPENMRLNVVSKTFESKCDQIEPWMEVPYGVEDMESDTIDKCKSPTENLELKLPEPNPYLPENVELNPADGDISEYPTMVSDTEICRAWHKQDVKYRLPNAYLSVVIMSPVVSASSKEGVLAEIFAEIFFEAIEEITYPAYYAGYQWTIKTIPEGFLINVKGYSDKLQLLTEVIFSNLQEFTYTDELFANIKDRVQRKLTSTAAGDAYDIVRTIFKTLLNESPYFIQDQLKAIEDVTEKDLEDFRSRVFETVFIQILDYGNLNEEDGLALVDIVESRFKDKSQPLPSDEVKPNPIVYFEEGKSYLYKWETGKTDNTNTRIYYQCGEETVRNIAMTELLSSILDQGVFDQLRTKEQLGYVAYSSVMLYTGVQGVIVNVQSSDYSAEHLDSRIEAYIESVKERLQKMETKEFEEYKASLKDVYSAKPRDMSEQNDRFYSQIAKMTYDFSIRQDVIAELDSISLDQLLEFYNTYFKADSKSRTKVAIYIVPTDAKLENPSKYEPGEEVIVIENVAKFKETATYATVPSPPDDIPPIGKKQSGEKKNGKEKTDKTKKKDEEKDTEEKTEEENETENAAE